MTPLRQNGSIRGTPVGNTPHATQGEVLKQEPRRRPAVTAPRKSCAVRRRKTRMSSPERRASRAAGLRASARRSSATQTTAPIIRNAFSKCTARRIWLTSVRSTRPETTIHQPMAPCNAPSANMMVSRPPKPFGLARIQADQAKDRQSVDEGKGVADTVDLGGCRIITKKKKKT